MIECSTVIDKNRAFFFQIFYKLVHADNASHFEKITREREEETHMLVNDRDEINYHKFLKSMRKSQHVTLEQVALGVYTKSGMSRIESGERLPDKLVRDRLTARLGISGEEYEEYMLPREYKQWECRMDIIRCINKKDIAGAEEKIASYAENYNTNQVDIQFPMAMRFMVMKMKGCSDDELYKKVREAMDCTVLDVDGALDGVHLLADQELNLIMEYVRLRKEVIPERDLSEWKLSTYYKIRTYVENSRLDKIARAKVCSKLGCFVAEHVLAECENTEPFEVKEHLLKALELCNCAVESLRDSVRLYYFVELNEYRMKLIDALRVISVIGDDAEVTELYNTSKAWANLLDEMYKENDLPTYMENDTHLYTETECNNVNEVIRIRRAMMGLTREKFCGNDGEIRTLFRIENKGENPTMATVRDMLDRCGICAEYKRARVISSDVEALELAEQLIMEVNTGNYEKALTTHQILCEKLDLDIVFNEQEMKRVEFMILKNLNRVSKEEYREILTDILECTVALKTVGRDCEKYFTLSELACIHDFAKFTEGKDSNLCWKYLEKICFDVLEKEEIESSRFHTYEFLMLRCANDLGDSGRYNESINVSKKMLKESLRNKRMFYLVDCEYNIFWNQQKLVSIENKSISDEIYFQLLSRGVMLSNLSKKSNWKNFFQRKINEIAVNTIS